MIPIIRDAKRRLALNRKYYHETTLRIISSSLICKFELVEYYPKLCIYVFRTTTLTINIFLSWIFVTTLEYTKLHARRPIRHLIRRISVPLIGGRRSINDKKSSYNDRSYVNFAAYNIL